MTVFFFALYGLAAVRVGLEVGRRCYGDIGGDDDAMGLFIVGWVSIIAAVVAPVVVVAYGVGWLVAHARKAEA